MRPARFHADVLRHALRREKIATIEQLKAALGTGVDMTVFRKLREIVYHTSYSHRGKYYALDEVVEFDTRGLWSFRDVHFSRYGSLVDTVERFVQKAERGVLASELAKVLHVEVEEPLLRLVQRGRLGREKAGGVYLYGAADPEQRRQQVLSRQSSEDPRGRGRPRRSDRDAMDGILFVLRTGCQWNALNATGICSSSTAHRRFQEWSAVGVFEKLWECGLEVYDELKGLDWSWLSMDGAMTKAPLGGKKNRSEPYGSGQIRRQAESAHRGRRRAGGTGRGGRERQRLQACA